MTHFPLRAIVTVHDVELARRCQKGRIIVIDDDVGVRTALTALLEIEGYFCEPYCSAEEYLLAQEKLQPKFPGPTCVLTDVKLPGASGLQLQILLSAQPGVQLVFMSGQSSIEEAAKGFRKGAIDFLTKPIDVDLLFSAVDRALSANRLWQTFDSQLQSRSSKLTSLTQRELVVAKMVASGQTNAQIAVELGLALRTVKLYRHRAMEKLSVETLPDLVRLLDLPG